MIYDYLFYKSYQLGKQSNNFNDMPLLAGVIWVGACCMFNIFTFFLLLEAFGLTDGFIFEKKYKYIFSLSLVFLLILYYSFNSRYKKIIKKYDEKESIAGKVIHPIVVIILYYIFSFTFLLLAAMYKNGDGIFK